MDLGKLLAGHLLLINVLPQRETFYALSRLQQQSLGKCIVVILNFKETFKVAFHL